MSVWFATMLLPLLMAPPAAVEKVDAQMLLDLDLLSDDHFAAHAERKERAAAAHDTEMLDGLDWLTDGDEPTAEKPEQRRR